MVKGSTGAARAAVEVGATSAQQVIENIGSRMRTAREQLGLSLKDVATATGLSTAMVSLVERGKASPSVGTIVSISDALGLSMVGLFSAVPGQASPVIRHGEQEVGTTVDGMTRRVIASDPLLGIEMSQHFYEPGGRSGHVATHHTGYECGLVLAGQLCVELGGQVYELQADDAIRFASSVPHRFFNASEAVARAIWFNLKLWPESRTGSQLAQPAAIAVPQSRPRK
jgi:transcriptional regulator with XRE-family HTH domain